MACQSNRRITRIPLGVAALEDEWNFVLCKKMEALNGKRNEVFDTGTERAKYLVSLIQRTSHYLGKNSDSRCLFFIRNECLFTQ